MISASPFCQIVEIDLRRFEQRRLRERTGADLSEAFGAEDIALMPISPIEKGCLARFDALDAVLLRTVILLEQAGMSFGAACRFIRSAGISPAFMFASDADVFAGQWLEAGGVLRRVCGHARDIARAMPEAPLACVRINLTNVRDDITQRAESQLGLTVVGTKFLKGSAHDRGNHHS